MKIKTWILVAGSVSMEVLSWTTTTWPLAFIAAGIAFFLCGLLFATILNVKSKVIKSIVCILCVCIVFGHIYVFLWCKSHYTAMLTDVTVEEIEQTDRELCYVRVHENDGNDKTIRVLFKKEDAATLVVDSNNRYDILIAHNSMWPHHYEERSVKLHTE